MKRFAVFGSPISHSLSPQIHQAFARQFDHPIQYERIEADPSSFARKLEEFFALGGTGCNVTQPLKNVAFELVTELSPAANIAAAVNTISSKDRGLLGDNTDGPGLIKDLAQRGIQLTDKEVLLLGAGGAASGVLSLLLEQAPCQLTLANRSEEKAVQLAERFAGQGALVVCPLSALAKQTFDVIINATSAGLGDALVQIPGNIFAHATYYDLNYANAAKGFMQYAIENGANRCFDGIGMLIEQAAIAYEVWHGVYPDTSTLKATLGQGN